MNLETDGEPVPDDSRSLEYSLTLASLWYEAITPKEITSLLLTHGFQFARAKGIHRICFLKA